MIDVALAVVRIWLGVVLLAHGYHHARSLPGTRRWFAAKGFRHPRVNAFMSAVGELAIGAALVSGIFTSVAAAGTVALMVTAFWSIHRFAGFYVFARPDEGWEYVATLTAAATALALAGPGRFSLDRVLGLDTMLSGWVGAALVAFGLVGGALHLRLFWQLPTTDE